MTQITIIIYLLISFTFFFIYNYERSEAYAIWISVISIMKINNNSPVVFITTGWYEICSGRTRSGWPFRIQRANWFHIFIIWQSLGWLAAAGTRQRHLGNARQADRQTEIHRRDSAVGRHKHNRNPNGEKHESLCEWLYRRFYLVESIFMFNVALHFDFIPIFFSCKRSISLNLCVFFSFL